ncbi:MAG: DUF2085 domain-containing protein [Actinomycetota bacterium]|nr:DUF2085 domain-containing protein [Actinomycetota bacterium]
MQGFISFLTWIFNQIGYSICHQIESRTLHFGGKALPVCARDTGTFIGFTFCFVLLLAFNGLGKGRYPSRLKVIVICLLLLPTIVDGVTSYAGLRETSNAVRLITGSCAGVALAALVFPLFSSLFSRKRYGIDEESPLDSWWSILLLLLTVVFIFFLLMPDWPGAFWFWSAVEIFSIIFTLAVLNFMLIRLVLLLLDKAISKTATLFFSFLALACELAISNRLHWLLDRVV